MFSDTPAKKKPVIKIFGVGSAGITIIEEILRAELPEARFIATNTDEASLRSSSAAEKVHVETKLLRGRGAGTGSERMCIVAEEAACRLKTCCEGADVVFLVAGL